MKLACSSGWAERCAPRFKVLLMAKLKASTGTLDVCIRDVSERGLLAQASRPPERGAFVEITGFPVPIVGRVAWCREHRFGISLRDRLDIEKMLDRPIATASNHGARPSQALKSADMPKQVTHPEFSRIWGNMFEHAAIAAAGIAAAILLASLAYKQFTHVSKGVAAGFERTASE